MKVNYKQEVLKHYPCAKLCTDDDGESILIVAPGIILSDTFQTEHQAWKDAYLSLRKKQ